MIWVRLESAEQLQEIKDNSKVHPVLIFKHSTSCSTSRIALDRLERNWKQETCAKVKPVYLDLLRYRALSNQIAEDFSIQHESPQVLLIENGCAVYNRAQWDIDYQDILRAIGERSWQPRN